jgi:hypothetical protein
MLEALVLGGSLIVGLTIGRWWAVLIGVPIGVWSAYHGPIENSEPPYWGLGLVVAIVVGAAIAAGVALRRNAVRSPR